ncbi:O-antigen polymerase [Leifsonia kafniensis]|uniref:O-antigen polymerase n=1 Tax=Leifsonia kafniensis TaxID=475957 RepID=A0ABP7KU63_9MICO
MESAGSGTLAPTGETTGMLPFLGFAVLGGLLSGVVPLLLILQVPDVGRSDAWILTVLLTVWAGLRLTMTIVVGRPMLFDFFFWMFTYVFMGIAPTVQIRSGLISRTTQGIDEGLDLPTAVLVCVGVVCYEIGRYLARIRGNRRAADATSRGLSARAPEELTVVDPLRTALLLTAGVALSTYFIAKIGLGSLFGSRDQAFAARSAQWSDPAIRSIMYSLAIYPLLVGIGALAQVRRSAVKGRGWFAIPLIGATLLLLTVVNPVSSARYSLGTVIFALALYAGAALNPTRVRTTLVTALAGLIFLFPLADAFRRPEVNLARDGFFGEYKGNPDYDAFWQIANAFSYWLDGLVEPGRQALGSLLFWVPRSIWPDKPVDTGILLAQYRGYSFENLSAPLWAELLVNGGVIALIIGFLATGYFLRVMDDRLLPAFAAAGYWAIVGAIFPVYMTILLRGSLLQATGAVAVALLCLLVVRKHNRLPAADGLASSDRRLSEPPQSPAFRTGRG